MQISIRLREWHYLILSSSDPIWELEFLNIHTYIFSNFQKVASTFRHDLFLSVPRRTVHMEVKWNLTLSYYYTLIFTCTAVHFAPGNTPEHCKEKMVFPLYTFIWSLPLLRPLMLCSLLLFTLTLLTLIYTHRW